MWGDFRGRAVLITGGTKGIGLATGLAFGRRGAAVSLTHKWGSADIKAVRAAFASAGALEPDLIDADAADESDTRAVLSRVRERHERLDVLISNVAFAPLVRSFDDYNRRGLAAAMDYSTWPIVSHTRAAKEVLGSYPRYVVGFSSEGMDSYHVNYDIVAAAKAALEALCRYMHHRLREQGTRVNLVKTRFVSTDSLRATAGEDFEAFVETHSPGLFTTPKEIAEAVVGLCSGLMDGVGGQSVVVDRGASVFDNFGRLYAERDHGTRARAGAPKTDAPLPTSDGRVVLVTGGTRGIGLGTALAFAREGARLVLTYKWGSADEDALKRQFAELGAPAPLILEADVSRASDTKALFATIEEECGPVDVFVSNAAPAVSVRGIEDYTERGFLKTLRAAAWPIVEYTLAAGKQFGRYPRYIIAMSSDGPDRFMPGYDFVACSKAAVETLVRYLSYRLRDEEVRISVLRSRAIRTDAFSETFGADFYDFVRRLTPDDWFTSVEEVANAAVALCSGMFDGMTGQVLTVDRGNTFADGISIIYGQREALGL